MRTEHFVLLVVAVAACVGVTPPWTSLPPSLVGSRIAFSSGDIGPGGPATIYAMEADGSGVIRLSDGNQPVWSPDCNRLAFNSFNGNTLGRGISVMDAGGLNVVDLTNGAASDESPAWSPDGSRIAFESGGDPYQRHDIFVMDAAGSNRHNLTKSGDSAEAQPAWSPDGSRIAFVRGGYTSNDIYVMDADGSNVVNLTNDESSNESPAWSPDGSRIVFESDRDNYPRHGIEVVADIFVMNADGSSAINLTDSDFYDWDPVWSPNGSWIAFASDRDGNFEIYAMKADGSNVARLTDSASDDRHPDWCVKDDVP